MAKMKREVFLSGGTGYMGRALTEKLLDRGHHVRVLTRPGSESKVAGGAAVVRGNALEEASFAGAVGGSDTYVHLTGVTHPAPWKEREFRAIDQASLQASARAACAANAGHFVYVSVAQPAPVMRAYLQVRQECEDFLSGLGLTCTILRPWYVLGPGHRWPAALKPVYAMLEAIPSTRAGALRLGLVTREQMTTALAWAVENPPDQTRILDVPAIRSAHLVQE